MFTVAVRFIRKPPKTVFVETILGRPTQKQHRSERSLFMDQLRQRTQKLSTISKLIGEILGSDI